MYKTLLRQTGLLLLNDTRAKEIFLNLTKTIKLLLCKYENHTTANMVKIILHENGIADTLSQTKIALLYLPGESLCISSTRAFRNKWILGLVGPHQSPARIMLSPLNLEWRLKHKACCNQKQKIVQAFSKQRNITDFNKTCILLQTLMVQQLNNMTHQWPH